MRVFLLSMLGGMLGYFWGYRVGFSEGARCMAKRALEEIHTAFKRTETPE